jgi:aldehyde:ferredoxin oxidoreductase
LELASGRSATLTADRLQTMINGYYVARGFDQAGRVATADLPDLFLDA